MPLDRLNVQCCRMCQHWLTTEKARIKCPKCGLEHKHNYAMLTLFTKHFTPFRMLGRGGKA